MRRVSMRGPGERSGLPLPDLVSGDITEPPHRAPVGAQPAQHHPMGRVRQLPAHVALSIPGMDLERPGLVRHGDRAIGALAGRHGQRRHGCEEPAACSVGQSAQRHGSLSYDRARRGRQRAPGGVERHGRCRREGLQEQPRRQRDQQVRGLVDGCRVHPALRGELHQPCSDVPMRTSRGGIQQLSTVLGRRLGERRRVDVEPAGESGRIGVLCGKELPERLLQALWARPRGVEDVRVIQTVVHDIRHELREEVALRCEMMAQRSHPHARGLADGAHGDGAHAVLRRECSRSRQDPRASLPSHTFCHTDSLEHVLAHVLVYSRKDSRGRVPDRIRNTSRATPCRSRRR